MTIRGGEMKTPKPQAARVHAGTEVDTGPACFLRLPIQRADQLCFLHTEALGGLEGVESLVGISDKRQTHLCLL
jgi:hypothetical protein